MPSPQKTVTANRLRALALVPALAAVALATSGCSAVRKLAVNSLAGTFSGAGEAFASDDDPELVRDALPFALKTFESLLETSPENVGLRLSTCQGFLLYGYAFVELEAERLEVESYRAAQAQRDRALKLYRRARGHCLAALDREHPGLREALVRDPAGADLSRTAAGDLDVLYWTAMSWGAAIALGLDQPELVVDTPAVRRLFERCLELDPDYGRGALHDAMIAIEGLPETLGGSIERARRHFDRALELHGGRRANTYVLWAVSVSLRQQDRAEFEEMLRAALAIDAEDPALRSERLANLIAQRRAEFLLGQADVLFLADPGGETETGGQP